MAKAKVVKFVSAETKADIKRNIKDKNVKRSLIRERNENISFIGHILGFIIMLLLIAMVIRYLNNETSMPTFRSLLETFATNENKLTAMKFDTLDLNGFLTGEWSILDGFRSFLYALFGAIELILNLVIFVGQAIYNLVIYLISLLSWLLGSTSPL